jgi:hypothetical protein
VARVADGQGGACAEAVRVRHRDPSSVSFK